MMQTEQTSLQSAECPVCGALSRQREDTIEGELVSCVDCGSELEVTSLTPFTVEEAPQAAEDWGE